MKLRLTCLISTLFLFASCQFDKKQLIGNWELIQTSACSHCEADYYIFSDDSVQRFRDECLLAEKGTYTLNKNVLEMSFTNGNKQNAIIQFDQNNTDLIINTENNTIRSTYHKVDHVPKLTSRWDTPCSHKYLQCIENCVWRYTGRKYKSALTPIVNTSDTTIVPPSSIDLRRMHNPNFGYDACIIRKAIPNSSIAFLIEKYTGNELFLIPRCDTRLLEGENGFHSDTVFIYERVYL
jgi:hypothetical protein